MSTNKIVAIAIITTSSFSTFACVEESPVYDDVTAEAANDMTDVIHEAGVTPDPGRMARAMESEAYLAFAEEFEAKGYVPKPEYAVDMGTFDRDQVYVMPFETGSETLIVATGFRFENAVLTEVSAVEYPLGDIDAGIMYVYRDELLYAESLDPSFRSFSTWWDCFWRNAGATCVGSPASCYWSGTGIWACIAATCGVGSAWWAVACL